MFVEQENEENIQNNLINNEIEEELEGDWDTLGDELFYRKNKFEFEEKEKRHIRKMLSRGPPKLQHRRRVITYIYNSY